MSPLNFQGILLCVLEEVNFARDACSSWNTPFLRQNNMSRAQIAEALLKNVLYFFDNTKHLKQGAVISCRQFLLAVCFHKHGFPKHTYSARKLADVTKINRKTLATHINSKQLLRDVRYKPFVKGSPSNYWGKRAVSRVCATPLQCHYIQLHFHSKLRM